MSTSLPNSVAERVRRLERAYTLNESLLEENKKALARVASERKEVETLRKQAIHALRIIQHVGTETQKTTVLKIEGLVTSALRDVFQEDGYDFAMELSYSKRSMSAEFYFVRDGEQYDPLECCGYGCVDVACFALRVAIWSLNPSTRVMLFDEPFKNVSQEYRERVGQLVRKISRALKFQFIITTHMPELATYADADFFLTKRPGRETSIERRLVCGQRGNSRG